MLVVFIHNFNDPIDGKARTFCCINRDYEPPIGCGKDGELFEPK